MVDWAAQFKDRTKNINNFISAAIALSFRRIGILKAILDQCGQYTKDIFEIQFHTLMAHLQRTVGWK